MDKSGAAVMDGIGYTKSSPSFAPIEIIDPHPPKATLSVRLRISLPVALGILSSPQPCWIWSNAIFPVPGASLLLRGH